MINDSINDQDDDVNNSNNDNFIDNDSISDNDDDMM